MLTAGVPLQAAPGWEPELLVGAVHPVVCCNCLFGCKVHVAHASSSKQLYHAVACLQVDRYFCFAFTPASVVYALAVPFDSATVL
jgi:hypothetical protein